MTKNKPLIFDADFDLAIILKTPVTVWQDNEILDYGGVVESYDDGTVIINGAHFMRNNCEFRIR